MLRVETSEISSKLFRIPTRGFLRGRPALGSLLGVVRVNIEESVFEHIPRLASEMGWDFDRALGKLARVYRATQDAEIYEEESPRLVTVCALIFTSDDEAERFFTAMIRAQLAVLLDDRRVRIRGNKEHIERLNGYRARASAGGIARSRKSNDFVASKQAPSKHQLATPLSTNEPSLAPLLPFSNTEETTKNLDLASTPKKKRTRKPKDSSGASPPEGRTTAFRLTWLQHYKKKYGTDYPWGARENGQTATLLGTYSSDQLCGLVPYWFAWQRPEVIRGGHSFGKGPACFLLKLDELRADIADSDRRKTAAQVASAERQAENTIASISQAERVANKLSGATNEISGGDGLGRIEQGNEERAGGVLQEMPSGDCPDGDPDGGDLQPEAI